MIRCVALLCCLLVACQERVGPLDPKDYRAFKMADGTELIFVTPKGDRDLFPNKYRPHTPLPELPPLGGGTPMGASIAVTPSPVTQYGGHYVEVNGRRMVVVVTDHPEIWTTDKVDTLGRFFHEMNHLVTEHFGGNGWSGLAALWPTLDTHDLGGEHH